jgi:hypothetical protein
MKIRPVTAIIIVVMLAGVGSVAFHRIVPVVPRKAT